jgi:hypothetical protein
MLTISKPLSAPQRGRTMSTSRTNAAFGVN